MKLLKIFIRFGLWPHVWNGSVMQDWLACSGKTWKHYPLGVVNFGLNDSVFSRVQVVVVLNPRKLALNKWRPRCPELHMRLQHMCRSAFLRSLYVLYESIFRLNIQSHRVVYSPSNKLSKHFNLMLLVPSTSHGFNLWNFIHELTRDGEIYTW